MAGVINASSSNHGGIVPGNFMKNNVTYVVMVFYFNTNNASIQKNMKSCPEYWSFVCIDGCDIAGLPYV